jgi:enoyl-CoA hydratase
MLASENYESIKIDKRDDGVTVATLNRPERMNAISSRMHTEMARLPRDADSDPSVKVLVITGAGGNFCVGADLTGPPIEVAPGSAVFREARDILSDLLSCETPIISAVRGYAVGFGATYALLADVVFAGRTAIFADTHVNIGVGAGDGGQLIWPLLVGVNRAKYYLMTGEKLAAEEAERIGLVNFVVDDENVLDAALGLAIRWANGPIRAISASKVGINAYIRMLSSVIVPVSMHAEQVDLLSDDRREAMQAFREKRPPQYADRSPRGES